jgi:beta-glucosidase
MSFPKTVGQCPVYYNRPSTGRPKKAPDDEFEPCTSSYRDGGNLPLYSFGHGLSYSNFVYESLVLSCNSMTADSSITATVTLRNDSEMGGQEVVQLYMHDLVASTVRPVQSLIGFEKVYIAPGERKTVTFTVTEPMLRFCGFDGRFISEPGEFTLSVGYADHLILTQKFELE